MPKISCYIQARLVQFTGQKKNLKNDQELNLLKYATIKILQYQHCTKI